MELRLFNIELSFTHHYKNPNSKIKTNIYKKDCFVIAKNVEEAMTKVKENVIDKSDENCTDWKYIAWGEIENTGGDISLQTFIQ